MSASTLNVLILGSTGRTGRALIRALSTHSTTPSIHAFARTPSKLSSSDRSLCTSVQRGDATNISDLRAALSVTKANLVLVSLGVPNSTTKSTVRGDSAEALLSVLQEKDFAHVRVVVVSVVGAGGTDVNVGWGIGTMVTWMLKDVLPDHDRQEQVLGQLGNRVMIVRPMGLGEGKGVGGSKNVVEFEGKAPGLMIQRADLADWIVDTIVEGKRWGKKVNVVGKGGEEGIFQYFKREVVMKEV